MLRIGLTGGIGSGKSTVARRLVALGAVLIDADVLAREVVQPDTPGLVAIVERFGPEMLGADGSLDRAALGAIVFADPQARHDLEAITHPRIAARTRELLDATPREATVVHDIPLLVEQHRGAAYHLVLVVDAPAATRVERLARDRGMDPSDAERRIEAQADDAARRAAADIWLDNNGTSAAVEAMATRVWEKRLVPYEENLLAGIPAAGPYAADDPDQSATGVRLGARVAHLLGVPDATVETGPSHQTFVIEARLREGTVLETRLLARLAEGGFVRSPDQPAGSGLSVLGCDPGRAVRVRVSGPADPGQPVALPAS